MPGPGANERLAELGAAWDERYRSAPRVFRAEPDETLAELAGPLPPGHALDLGAGEGRNSLFLARRGWQVVAVDASPVLAFVHPEPAARGALLAAASRAVAPGGHLFVVGHHRSSLGVAGPPDPARLYEAAELLGELVELEVLGCELRHGLSDVAEQGADVWVWARRPAGAGDGATGRIRPAS